MKKDDRERCSWATTELYKEYHDEEWGKPVHDDRKLFEMLVLEGMQAGLSWLTILNKRAAFKEAFNEFDYQKIALYDETKIDELMQNPNIVRNRLKIKSTITNAQQFIKIQEEYGSFDKFIWSYVKNRPIHNHFKSEADIPATTPLSDRISNLRRCRRPCNIETATNLIKRAIKRLPFRVTLEILFCIHRKHLTSNRLYSILCSFSTKTKIP